MHDEDFCKDCANHFHTVICKECYDNSKFNELYNADENCKHEIIHASGGGIKCIKCGGWFCY